MYSVNFYGQMLADASRMNAYTAALRRAVKPDSVVMDLGCGAGVFALLACKLGARRVYAVEPENIIGLAREAAAVHGFSERIEFFEKLSTELTLPEPATIIISDLRGVLPWFEQNVYSIIDARARLLAPGGVLIPHRDVLWASVVEAPNQYGELVDPWRNQSELDLSVGKRFVTNTWRKSKINPEQLLTDPVCWNTLDYYEVTSPDVHAEISWQAARKGTAHGIAVWFDSELAEGICFSNHPAALEMIYGTGFFPFLEPVELMENEHVTVTIAADLVNGSYVWRWNTEIPGKASFKQSTFFGVPLSSSQLPRNDPGR